MKRNPEKLDLCVHKLSAAIEDSPGTSLENCLLQKKCPASLPLQDCLLCWHLLGAVGEGEQAIKELFMTFPA